MAIAPPKRIRRRPKRRGKTRGARRLPSPTNAPKIERPTETPDLPSGGPIAIGKRPPKRKGETVPRTIQGSYKQMEKWMAEAFTKMGAPELIGQVPWHWNSRLTATMGQAHFRYFAGVIKPVKMDFAPRLFKRASTEERRQTVYHECAHIVDYHMGTYVEGKAHGPSWRRIMRRAGMVPKRTHDIMPVGRVKGWCLCKTPYVTKKMRNHMKAGETRRCKQCGSKVSWVKPQGR